MRGKTMKETKTCFVIMPISDPVGYDQGHFKCVYEDIFKPAIEDAGFIPKRADDDESSSMIQVNIIKDIITAPMAICDLSTRNPNVLFELGIRQAFDLPVVLVQEEDTPRIFDISTINTIDYRKNLLYRNVLEDRKKIEKAIKATECDDKGINSIIKLLQLEKATINTTKTSSELDDIRFMFYTLSNQISKMNKEKEISKNKQNDDIVIQWISIFNKISSLIANIKNDDDKKLLKQRCNEYLSIIEQEDSLSERDKKKVMAECEHLIDRIEKARY